MSVIERIQQIRASNVRQMEESKAKKALLDNESRERIEQEWLIAKAIFAESSAETLLQELNIHFPGEISIQKEQKLMSLRWGDSLSGSYISISADIKNNTLVVSGSENFVFRSNQLKDVDAIEEALAKAYLNPHKYDHSWSVN